MDFSKFGNTGGGFFTDANHFDSPSQIKKSDAPKKAQNVFPVLIQQIHNCAEDEFKIFGMNAQMVRVVGILRQQDVQSTKAIYEVEDHTGSITALYWLDNDNTSANLPAVKEGSYVCIYGIIRVHDNKKNLMIMKMMPVNNLNVINTHLLEVIFVRSQAKLAATNLESSSSVPANNPGIQFANSMNIMSDNNKLTDIQEKICKILQPCQDGIGITKNKILEQFPSHQHNQVREQIDFLAMEGHIYSTIDQDHFVLTSSV